MIAPPPRGRTMGPYYPKVSSDPSYCYSQGIDRWEMWAVGLSALALVTVVGCILMVIAIVG